jgi:hypothetical protein
MERQKPTEFNSSSEDNNKCKEHFNFRALWEESCREIILRWILEEIMKIATKLKNHALIGFSNKLYN